MNESELNILRHQALETFKLEKSFLRDLEDSNNNSDITFNLIFNATDNQLKSLILILFFIFKKEIPVAKKTLHKFSNDAVEKFETILKQTDYTQMFALFSREQFMSIAISFRKVLPFLVKPILHKDG